jgi:hypothetical protein
MHLTVDVSDAWERDPDEKVETEETPEKLIVLVPMRRKDDKTVKAKFKFDHLPF